MSSGRLHPHPSLPAPVVHAGFTAPQSKSTVLAGVQDAYWSDDEGEDAECPLCLEEMDISELNFKPCPCGYQICRFCWHHIKENLNKRCPACRRVYTDDAVQFKPMAKEDHKRLTQQKKQRERERKDLDALNRRHLANVRVVQRNVVYVVGIGQRFAKEELIPTLRSNEYFGQYGKISKILLVKRTPSGGGAPVVGLYITYHRREDAARAIAAVDGTASPGGGAVMRASYGTTKYCMAFLRAHTCTDHSCMNLHEWGDEKDCFTKEDLTTLKHTMKDTESRSRNAKKGEESDGLPRGASWASKPAPSVLPSNPTAVSATASSNAPQERVRRSRGGVRQHRSAAYTGIKEPRKQDRNARAVEPSTSGGLKSAAQPPSRPSTPASQSQRAPTPSEQPRTKTRRAKEAVPQQIATHASRASTPSAAPGSDAGSASQEAPAPASSPPPRPKSGDSAVSSAPSIPAVPPGLPVATPAAPPGLPPPRSAAQRGDAASPGTPVLASQSSYQMSTAARALLEDVTSRRSEQVAQPDAPVVSPFPELEQTLKAVGGDSGGFTFSLDPSLADDVDSGDDLDFDPGVNIPYRGSFVDAFPALRPGAPPTVVPPALRSQPMHSGPPGLPYPSGSSRFEPFGPKSTPTPPLNAQVASSPSTNNYKGSFNPFSDPTEDAPPPSPTAAQLDDDPTRKVSRFGFARDRRGSTAASSPLHTSSPLSHAESRASVAPAAADTPSPSLSQWSLSSRQPQLSTPAPQSAQSLGDLSRFSVHQQSSPSLQHGQAYLPPQQQPASARFQPFGSDNGVSEAQLRELIQTSRMRTGAATSLQSSSIAEASEQPFKQAPTQQPFNDPAIMSAHFAAPGQYSAGPPGLDGNALPPHMAFGPPPGLSFPPGIHPTSNHSTQQSLNNCVAPDHNQGANGARVSLPGSNDAPSSPQLDSSDFPALNASPSVPTVVDVPAVSATAGGDDVDKDAEAKEKAERKAAKKAAAAERAVERQKLAKEKAAARAVEKAKIAAEKAAEKEKAVALKAEQDRLASEKAERERAAREKVLKEKAAQAEKERAAKAEKERIAHQKEKDRAAREAEQTQRTQKGKAKGKSAATVTPAAQDTTPPRRGPKVEPAQEATTTTPKASDKQAPSKAAATSEPVGQVPLLSKMPKKNRPAAKPIRIPSKDETAAEDASTIPSTAASETAPVHVGRPGAAVPSASSSSISRSQSSERSNFGEPTPLADLLEDIDLQFPHLDLPNHPFFDLNKINPASKMPLEYGPLVHALSALSVGGGSFANNMPSGSIDNAVSSFQQLLETLTQTISDLLRLLPRTTWDDSSSFDGVLQDMLKGDDFLDETADDGPGTEDEVAALTLALERRARWMEVQLSKLEELHRDINTAAVRAVLSFNDSGWDRHGFLPRSGLTLRRFDNIGLIADGEGGMRRMTADELERKLVVAKEAAAFAEMEMRELCESMQEIRPLEFDE